MSDRGLETRLRTAQRTKAAEKDPGALLERVLSIPDTVEPQRRRWWHGFRTGSPRGAGLGGATTKGGPMMLSAMKAAAVVAVLALTGTFALSGMLGPDPEPLAPGAETPAGTEWVTVTGTETFACGSTWCRSVDVMDDSRVSGEGRATWRSQGQTSTSSTNHTLWGEYGVTNEGGSWAGDWIGFVDEDGMHHITWWMLGSGDYEGLAYVATGEQQPSGELDLTGLIYPGDIPPTVALGLEAEPAA